MITGTAERLTPLPLSPSSFSEPSLITLSAEGSISPHKPIVHPKKERLKTNDDAASILSNSGPISTEKTRDSVAVASVVPAEEPSPLVADLNENDFAFDPEAQSHLNKSEEALANRIKANSPMTNSTNTIYHYRPFSVVMLFLLIWVSPATAFRMQPFLSSRIRYSPTGLKLESSPLSTDVSPFVPVGDRLSGEVQAAFSDIFSDLNFTVEAKKPLPMDSDPIYIITSPSKALKHPYFGDEFLQKAISTIDYSLAKSPCPRSKPLLATMRGVGGGKTRFFEEIGKHLRTRPETLTISVTFNGITNWKPDEIIHSNDPELVFALGIIARSASAFYRIPFTESVGRMKIKTDFFSSFDSIYVPLLLREFCKFLIAKAGKPVKEFVLMVDEVALIQEAYRLDGSITSPLHSAVLDEYIVPNVSAALIISSLSLKPIHTPDSGRALNTLPILETFEPEEILDKWVKADLPDLKLTRTDRFRLGLCLLCFNSLGRTVEFFVDFLRSHPPTEVDNKYVKDLFEDIFNQMRSRYEFTELFPSITTFRNIINEKSQALDQQSLLLVRKSVLINSLRDTRPRSKLFPKTSIASIYLAACDTTSSYPERFTVMVKAMMESLINRVINFKRAGDLLETVGNDFLRLKIQAMSANLSEIRMDEFFLLPVENYTLIKPLTVVRMQLPNPTIRLEEYEHVLELDSHTEAGRTAFYKSLATLNISEGNPLALFKITEEEEGFDQLMVVRNLNKPESPFLIFFDYESKRESSKAYVGIPNEDQKDYILKLKNHISQLPPELSGSQVLKSFSENNFLHIFVTTGKKKDLLIDRFLVLGESTAKYFSFIFPLLQALREPVT
jgi:hypothetical protein